MLLFLSLLSACDGCRPKIPAGSPDDPPVDTSEPPEDSADSAVETGPPPLCDLEEVEPNDVLADAQALPMELSICGAFGTALDFDWLTFSNTQEGWVKVEVEAAARGSSANAQLVIQGSDGQSALMLDGYLTTDPGLVFPVSGAGTWQVNLAESNRASGDSFTWWLRATQSKVPVTWTFLEAEANDTWSLGQSFEMGGTVFGSISDSEDFDWYHIVTAAEEATITFDVEAYAKGSAANLKLVLYEADGVTMIEDSYRGEIDYDPDPHFRQRTTGGSDWYLLVRTEDSKGSPFHWYTLSITSTPTGA